MAFGKAADGLYNDILGKPATATADRVPGAYDAAQRRSHTIIPVVEVFGGIHADGLCSKHGARLGADELSAPWCASSFRSIHAQRLSIAMHVAAAEENP